MPAAVDSVPHPEVMPAAQERARPRAILAVRARCRQLRARLPSLRHRGRLNLDALAPAHVALARHGERARGLVVVEHDEQTATRTPLAPRATSTLDAARATSALHGA